MENNAECKTYKVIIFLLAGVITGLIIGLNNANTERAKYEEIIDLACDYSGNKVACQAGVDVIKKLDLDTLHKMKKGSY